MIFSDRQFFLLREAGGQARYYLGWCLPVAIKGYIPCRDSNGSLSWQEFVFERRVGIPTNLSGYVTSFSSAVVKDNSLADCKYLYLLYATCNITAGTKKKYPDLLPAAFAGFLKHGTLQRLSAYKKEVLTQTAHLYSFWEPDRFLDLVMLLEPKKRQKFVADTIDWLSLIGGLRVSRSYVNIEVRNTGYRLVLQALFLDLGFTPAVAFNIHKTIFKFKRNTLNTLRSIRLPEEPLISRVRIKKVKNVFDRGLIFSLEQVGYLGNNLLR